LYIHYAAFVVDRKPPLNLLFFVIKMPRPNESQVKIQTVVEQNKPGKNEL
jgi:hypothetical protein